MPLEQYNQLNTAAAANLKQLAADGEGRELSFDTNAPV
jgi:hypothetical protein